MIWYYEYGETLNYYCPICKKILEKKFEYFDSTNIVNYNNIQLYVTHCIECHTEIAIQPIKPRNIQITTKNELFTNLVNDTKQLVSTYSSDINENEITEEIFDTLSHKYEPNILKANEIEIKQIIQYQLCQQFVPSLKSFVYADIKNNCKNIDNIYF